MMARGAAQLLNCMVALWIFTGGLVMFEPSPYEITFLLLLPVALIGGFGLHRSTLLLLWIVIGFIPFALIAVFQVRNTPTSDALVFALITIFLLGTSYFVANYVAGAPQGRMRIIIGAYSAAAVLSALVGTLGYLGYLPGSELFLRYGRAKALFEDPNVFGPFLILPAMFALRAVLFARGWAMVAAGIVVVILAIGVFASFSRGAWGHLAASALLLIVLAFFLEAGARAKVRMMLLTMVAALAIVVTIGGLLTLPPVQRLFEVRTAAQAYDSGETGRFGRQAFAYELALAHPWGIGPFEFRKLRVGEEPHNTYVNVFHVYGWGGGLAFYALIALTLWRAALGLAGSRENRAALIPLVATFVPLVGEAAIIDVDHWRHFFLIIGLIWGVTAVRRGHRGARPAMATLRPQNLSPA